MNKIKAVVVGLNFGEWVIQNELINGGGKAYIEMVAVCDLNKEKVDQFSKRYRVKAYYDLEDALADKEIEAVILITGPVGRAKLIDKIVSKGKPVMTTKPFDTSSEETLNVLTKARAMNIPVFMNSPTPLASDELEQVQKWIEKYDLGRPVGYRASTWCSYRERPDGSWYDDPNLCPAAPIFRLGIYLLNDLCRFFAPVSDVNVMQSRIFTQRPTADNAQLGIMHQDGTIGSVFASFCIDDKQYYRCSFEINFERGTIYKNMGPVDTSDSGKIQMKLSANVNGQLVQDGDMFESGGAGYQWDTFYKAVRSDTRDKLLAETVAPEKVASVIKIIEKMRM